MDLKPSLMMVQVLLIKPITSLAGRVDGKAEGQTAQGIQTAVTSFSINTFEKKQPLPTVPKEQIFTQNNNRKKEK